MKKKACAVCLTNCLRLHGSEDEEDDEDASPICSSRGAKEGENIIPCHKPSFLKKITEATMTSAMQLPSSFVKAHIKMLSRTVTLEGPSREVWRVEVGGAFQKFTVSLRQGWRKFVTDHVLQIGDQLAFTLRADSCFQVEVYDESGCQKQSALDATNSPTTPLELKAKEPEIRSHERFQTSPLLRLSGRKQKERSEPDNATPSAKKPLIDLQSSGSESRSIGLPGNNFEVIKTVKPKNPQDRTSEMPDTKDGGLLPPHKLINGMVITERRPVTDGEKLEALQAARALQIVNPHTLMVMTRGYVYRGFWLGLTKQFARDWMPSESREVTLVNKSGNKWPVRWLHKDDGGQMGLSGGWRRFALDHRLEESDVCVFELLDRTNFVLLVHIFRVLGAPDEDVGDYCPSPVQARKGEGRKRKSTQKSPQYGDGHFAQSTPGQSPTKRILKLMRCSPGDNKASTSSAKSEELRYANGQQEKDNCMSIPSKLMPTDPIAAEVGHDLYRHQFVVDGSLEHASHKVNKKKISPRASCGAENDPTVILPVPESGIEEDAIPFANVGIRPLHSKPSAATSPRKSNRVSRNNDLVKLAKELLTQNSSKPGTPPSSAREDGNAHSQSQAVVPYQVHEEAPNLAATSLPVRYHAPTPLAPAEGKRNAERRLYTVVKMYKGRSREGQVEFLVDLEGISAGDTFSNSTRDENTGFWWVPTHHFEWGMDKCYID